MLLGNRNQNPTFHTKMMCWNPGIQALNRHKSSEKNQFLPIYKTALSSLPSDKVTCIGKTPTIIFHYYATFKKKLSKLLQIGFHQPSSVKQKTLNRNWATRTRLDIHRKHVIGKYSTNNSIRSRFIKLIKVNDLLQ